MSNWYSNTYGSIPKPPQIEPDIEKAYEGLTDETKDKYCFQHYGYPKLAEWMASSNDFLVLRRFSPLQVRCLLYLQNEIADYDRSLREWDQHARYQTDPDDGNSGWINADPDQLPGQPRPQILRRVVPLLQQYNELVQSFSQLKAKETASDHHKKNINNWFEKYGQTAIDENEQHFRGEEHDGDVFALLPKPRYPLVVALQSSRLVRRVFRLKPRQDRVPSEDTTYHSERAMERLATLIALLVGLGMTFGSVWWLNYVDNNVKRLAIITTSGGLMTAIAWLAAGERPFEILATFAAYMAALMIYRQISN